MKVTTVANSVADSQLASTQNTPAQTQTPRAGDVQQFQSLLGDASSSQPLATDEQLASLPAGELDRLRAQYGNDDTGLREEAYLLCEFYKRLQDTMLRNIALESGKYMQAVRDANDG